ncbi:MAG TPA: hypothetical protein PKH39_16275 [Woeseiaceae bacterium]|nr:hypothetical protein [Woeseiaceae bacterium]
MKITEAVTNAVLDTNTILRAGVSREGVSVETGYKRSTRNAYIQRLMLRKLLVVRGQDLYASPTLFDSSHFATKEPHA